MKELGMYEEMSRIVTKTPSANHGLSQELVLQL
jgi:hypothetical protein